MTNFSLSLTGVHARNETTIQATQDWERGRIDSARLAAALREDVGSLVEFQQELGFDYISDGQITSSWPDFLRPITDGFEGVKKGAMVRWYNTNTFYQTPIVDGPVSSNGQTLWRKVERRFVRGGSFRLALPDPLTFSELAEDRHYHDSEKLMFAYADTLNGELKTLQAKGVGYVQLSSPALVARFRTKPLSRDRLEQLGEALRAAVRGLTIPTGFHTFFGDASHYLPDLFDVLPTRDVGFDFTQTDPSHLSPTKKGIIAGISDARTTYLEGPQELREKTEEILDATGTGSVTLAPSCDLRYIPRISADEKLRRLSELKAEMQAS